MFRTLYVTTTDEKNRTHNYRLPVTDSVPEGHEITGVRKAGEFQFGQNLTPETVANLWTFKRQLEGVKVRRTK